MEENQNENIKQEQTQQEQPKPESKPTPQTDDKDKKIAELEATLKDKEMDALISKNGYADKYTSYIKTLGDKYGIDAVLQDKNLDVFKKSFNTADIKILNQAGEDDTNKNTGEQVENPMDEIFKNSINKFNKKEEK